MTWRNRLILLPCLLPALAFAAPDSPAKTDAKPTATSAPASKKVTLEFHGTLREALKKIASQAGISLIAIGEMNQPAEVMLTDASPEDALATVAKLYDLQVERQGNIWTVRPRAEAAQQAKLAEAGHKDEPEAKSDDEQQADEDATDEDNDEDEEAASVPTPPTPPSPHFPMAVPPPPGVPGQNFESELQRRIQERVQRKLMRKLHKDGKDISGTGEVVVKEEETVRNAVAFGGPLTVNGHIEEDAVSFGGPVHLGEHAQVDGDVTSFGGEVTREKGAIVGGKITSFGGAGMGKVLAGTMKHSHPSEDEDSESHIRFFSIPGFLLRYALMFGLGFLLMMFAPNQLKVIGGELRRDPVRCTLVGLVGSFVLMPLTLALCITVVGIPVAAALWVLVLVGVAMAITALANEVGERLPVFRMRKTQAVVLAVGLLVLMLAWAIPYLGWVLFGLIALLSLGAIVRTRLGTRGPLGTPQSWPTREPTSA